VEPEERLHDEIQAASAYPPVRDDHPGKFLKPYNPTDPTRLPAEARPLSAKKERPVNEPFFLYKNGSRRARRQPPFRQGESDGAA
jgi:hypothetical protein